METIGVWIILQVQNSLCAHLLHDKELKKHKEERRIVS